MGCLRFFFVSLQTPHYLNQGESMNMTKLVEKSCVDFTEALASKAPVPGGGGVAALVGALGTALCSMVGNFTVGKKKYADVEADVKEILRRAEVLKVRLLNLVDADAEAFEPLSKAYAIPKNDPTHDTVLETATLNACKAPVEMVRCCGEAIDLLEEMLEKGSSMLISDVGCGALLCDAAMKSAAMNVFVNTGSLKDRTLAGNIEDEINALVEQYQPKAMKIAETVSLRIRK